MVGKNVQDRQTTDMTVFTIPTTLCTCL